MNRIFLIIAFCAAFATISAQNNPQQYKLELPTVKGQDPEAVAKMLNTPNLHWRVEGAKTGKNPIKDDCAADCQTKYRHPILVGSVMEKKEATEEKRDTCCPTTNITNNYFDDHSITNNDNRITNNYPVQKAGFNLHGVAVSRWFAEGDILRSTDHSFKAAFPVVRLGWQVEGSIKEAPGFILQFETNLVGFSQNTDPGCTNCVPQEILKPNVGLQIKGTAKWQFSKRNSLSAYRKSTTVMLTKREAVPLPDEGWGVELEHKAGPLALHGGWVKNSSKANTIYVGLSANAFEKSSGQSKDRAMYNPDEKLSSKRSEARAARKAERKAEVAKQKAEQKEKDRLEKERFETLVSAPVVLAPSERILIPSYPGQSKKFSKINEEKLKLFSLVEENQKLWAGISDGKPTKEVRKNVGKIEDLRKKIAKMEKRANK